ncbi:hypothetical protein BKI52_33090 [marine bacterium AO1-C]|nr:hypothetical protein BKI52_33090 [marine bacterium AO1-C]
MVKELLFNTQDKPLQLVVTVKAPYGAMVRFSGINADPGKINSAYFTLQKHIKDLGTVTFPMPFTPAQLLLTVEANTPLEIVESKPLIQIIEANIFELSALKKEKLYLSQMTKDFIRHAVEFAEEAGFSQPGMTYSNDKGEFPILYFQNLQGTTTPARIHKRTGEIQISAAKFRKMTVPMRIFILLHEWAHWYKRSGNEIECDLFAARIFLGLGFPRYEAMSAVTEVLTDHPDHVERAVKLREFIREYRD